MRATNLDIGRIRPLAQNFTFRHFTCIVERFSDCNSILQHLCCSDLTAFKVINSFKDYEIVFPVACPFSLFSLVVTYLGTFLGGLMKLGTHRGHTFNPELDAARDLFRWFFVVPENWSNGTSGSGRLIKNNATIAHLAHCGRPLRNASCFTTQFRSNRLVFRLFISLGFLISFLSLSLPLIIHYALTFYCCINSLLFQVLSRT